MYQLIFFKSRSRFFCTIIQRGYDFLIFSFLLLLVLSFTAADSITQTQQIRDGETIKSAAKIFELGFFSTNTSMNRYFGVWYHKIPVQTVVWVANAENPLTDYSGSFTLGNGGNLVLFDGEQNIHWSANVSIALNDTSATLFDSSNLVLREENSGLVLWQSFDRPSNTLLPGKKIGLNLRTGESRMLRSWKRNNDPAPGIFSFGIDQRVSDQFFIWKKSVPYWRSGYWNRRTYDKTPEANNDFLFYFITTIINDELSYEYSGVYNNTGLVMDTSGQLHCQIWHDESNSWSLVWFQPQDRCSRHAGCGPYGICNNHNTPKCDCMPGFEPAALEKWNSGNWSDRCVRKVQLSCGNKDEFLSMGRIKIPDGDLSVVASVSPGS